MPGWTFRWLPPGSGRLSLSSGAGHLDLVRPAERRRAAAWAKVLRWYGAREVRESPAPFPAAVDERPRDRVIALGGAAAAPVARSLAVSLGRGFDRLGRPSAFSAWLKQHDPASVLVLAEAGQLDFETVTALQGAALERGCWFGVLAGRDAAALAFAAAKQLLAHGRTTGRQVGIDAVCDRQFLDGVEAPLTAAGVSEGLGADALAVTLMAHGEGSHLLLNEAVLCGRIGTVDRFRGVPLRHGCRHGHCKRAAGAGLPAIQAAGLRAVLASFLSCNSFSLAGQLYPSETSLVLAAAEGYAAYVISNAWSIPFTAGEAPLLPALAGRGVPLGEVVAFLNETKAERDRVDSYVLFGDPLASLTTPASRLDDLPRTAVPGDQPQWLRAAAPPPCRVAEYRVDGRPAGQLFLGRRRAIARIPAGASGRLERLDHTAEVRALDRHWTRLALSVEGLQDLEQALQEEVAAASDTAMEQSLATLRKLHLELERQLAAGRRGLDEAAASRLWDPAIDRAREQIGRGVAAWDATFAALTESHLLSGGVVGDRIYEALHRGYRERSSRWGERCIRCGVRTETISLEHLRRLPARTVVECPICGPLASYREGGPLLFLGLPEELRRGRPARLDAALTPGSGTRGPQDGFLVVEIRDKTKPRPFLRTALEQPLVDGRIELAFPLPADSGFDQHSMRAVWIGGLEIAFARRVFVLTPDRRTV